MPNSEPKEAQPKSNGAPVPITGVPASFKYNNKKIIIGLIIVVLVLTGVYLVFHSNKKSNTIAPINKISPAQVSITSTGFMPATITIKTDQAVTWTNQDSSPHWVASDPYPYDNTLAGLNSKHNLAVRDSYSYLFNKVGTYTYHDNLNPYTIKGTVIVKE
ncbi:MAG TPA: cupredoxin domain-containing protein [Candidatus Saccharimonadales bacterium]|nr:cupredoxin domain-containing protein [Candidatus Saccharimonadales bacterium]